MQETPGNSPLPSNRAPTIIPNTRKSNAITEEEKEIALKTYAATGVWGHSCRTAGRSVEAFRQLRKDDMEFEARVKQAHEDYGELLELEAHHKAVVGDLETTYDKNGNVVRERLVKSDRMHEVLLRANKPEKYREHSGQQYDPNIVAGVLVVAMPAKNHKDWMERFAPEQEVAERKKQEFLESQKKREEQQLAAASEG